MLNVLLIGAGAIAGEVHRQLEDDPEIRITHVIALTSDRRPTQTRFPGVEMITDLKDLVELPDFAVECAGVSAVRVHVVELLRRGVHVAVCSTGAFIHGDLCDLVRDAAAEGRAQVQVLSGAIGGIDALASARLLGLDTVTLTSRKPPQGWFGTPAEEVCDLRNLVEPAIIFRGCAREAAGLYPKNANSAATVALAGVGMEKTMVTLIADPAIVFNMHEIEAHGRFGAMRFTTSNAPLSNNPKTSAMAALSVLRAIHNRSAAMVV